MLLLVPSAAASESPPAVEVSLEAPWVLAHEAPDHLNLRYGDSAQGVRVQILPTAEWPAGVTPIAGGRPAQLAGVPMVQPPGPVRRVEVESQGPDLVVRLAGEPLSTVASRADAPEDPALTWVRLRPRGGDWRIVLDGLGTVTLPGEQARWTDRGLAVGQGAVLTTTALAHRSRLVDGCWQLSTTPAVERADPYPRTAWTWIPP